MQDGRYLGKVEQILPFKSRQKEQFSAKNAKIHPFFSQIR
jgi:hypothetical protein